MTGSDLIAEFDAIVANDLFPIGASTTPAKLALLNNAARWVFNIAQIPARNVQLTYQAGVSEYALSTLRLFTVSEVLVNDFPMVRGSKECGEYDVYDGRLVFHDDQPAGTIFKISGLRAPFDIADTAVELQAFPLDLQLPTVLRAVYNACGAHEDSSPQAARLAMIDRKIADDIGHYRRNCAAAGWGF